jgi:tetratricopeptide (TPR) repeat protein
MAALLAACGVATAAARGAAPSLYGSTAADETASGARASSGAQASAPDALLSDLTADATTEPAPPSPPAPAPAPPTPAPTPAPGPGSEPPPGATPPTGAAPPAPPVPGEAPTPPGPDGATGAPAPPKPPKAPPRPGDVEASAGLQALQVGDLAGARLHFEKALAVDPGHNVARSRLAYLKFRSADFAGAANDAGVVTTADPSDALAWIILGRAKEALGDQAGAAAAYSAAAPLSTTAKTAENLVSSALAHYLRAMQHIRKNETTDVEADLKELLRVYPKNAYAHAELGAFYVRTGRWEDALLTVQQAQDTLPDFHPQESWIYPNRRYTFLDMNLRLWKGMALRETGKTDLAIAEFEAVIPRAEGLAGGEIQKQQSASTAALEGTVDRSFANVHYEAALAYQKKGDATRAKSLLKQAQRLEIADEATLKKAKELQSQIH